MTIEEADSYCSGLPTMTNVMTFTAQRNHDKPLIGAVAFVVIMFGAHPAVGACLFSYLAYRSVLDCNLNGKMGLMMIGVLFAVTVSVTIRTRPPLCRLRPFCLIFGSFLPPFFRIAMLANCSTNARLAPIIKSIRGAVVLPILGSRFFGIANPALLGKLFGSHDRRFLVRRLWSGPSGASTLGGSFSLYQNQGPYDR